MTENEHSDKVPESLPEGSWDNDLADALIGRVMLVGLTFLDADEAVQKQEQFFGRVASVSPNKGIELQLLGSRDGEVYWLPPDMRGVEPAAAGEFRLRSTGETVVDPDYLSTWTVKSPEAS